jgi:hypothetical protein
MHGRSMLGTAMQDETDNEKTPATRAKRVEETARLVEEKIRANQWRRLA